MPKLTRTIGWLLSITGSTVCVLLAATNKLTLYIHPRYQLFTVCMAIIALAALIFAQLNKPKADTAPQEPKVLHDHSHTAANLTKNNKTLSNVSNILAAAIAISLTLPLLFLPTAALSTERAANNQILQSTAITTQKQQRVTNSETANNADQNLAHWATVLNSGVDSTDLAGQTANITGFITPDPLDPQNIVLITRYTVTCCIVDAQALTVPAYMPDWQQTYTGGDWINATGFFIDNPSALSTQYTVLSPQSIKQVNQPRNPYISRDN